MVSLYKYGDLPFNMMTRDIVRGKSLVGCTCGQLICEIDSFNCYKCGDVCCEECLTECTHCGKTHCLNCSDSRFECIICAHDTSAKNSKAYLVLDGGKIPVKNSSQMLKMVIGMYKSGDFRLHLNGQLYDYKYRSVALRNDSNIYDYFFIFEPSEQQIIKVNGKKIIV